MHDALASELSGLAVPAPEAQLLAIVFIQWREVSLTHSSANGGIIVYPYVVCLFQRCMRLCLMSGRVDSSRQFSRRTLHRQFVFIAKSAGLPHPVEDLLPMWPPQLLRVVY